MACLYCAIGSASLSFWIFTTLANWMIKGLDESNGRDWESFTCCFCLKSWNKCNAFRTSANSSASFADKPWALSLFDGRMEKLTRYRLSYVAGRFNGLLFAISSTFFWKTSGFGTLLNLLYLLKNSNYEGKNVQHLITSDIENTSKFSVFWASFGDEVFWFE